MVAVGADRFVTLDTSLSLTCERAAYTMLGALEKEVAAV